LYHRLGHGCNIVIILYYGQYSRIEALISDDVLRWDEPDHFLRRIMNLLG
jgi:hypothetical protein